MNTCCTQSGMGLESFKKFMASKKYAQTVEFGKSIIDGQPRHKIFY